MEVKIGFKQTEFGLIPEDWNVSPLKGNVSISHGFAFSSRFFAANGLYRLTTPGHFHQAGGFRDIGDKQKFYTGPVPMGYVLSPGDLIVAMTEQADGLLGSAAVIPKVTGYLHNQRLGRVKTLTPDIYLPFLFWVLNSASYRSKVRETAAGTKVKHTSPEKLLEISVPLPPEPEQYAICEALGDADRLIGSLERLIAKKRDIKLGVMQQLLTGKTRLPGFTSEWKPFRLGDQAKFLRNGVNSRAELSPEGRVKYLHYGDIHACPNVHLSPVHLPSLPSFKAVKLDRLENGDLVLADASEDIDGVCKSVEIEHVGQTQVVAGLHTIAVRFDKDILADGFKGYLQFCPEFTTHLRRHAAGTKVYATNRAHVAGVEMRLPSPEEQGAIAGVIRDLDAEIDALSCRLAKTHDMKQGMMQELLTGKTRLITPEVARA